MQVDKEGQGRSQVVSCRCTPLEAHASDLQPSTTGFAVRGTFFAAANHSVRLGDTSRGTQRATGVPD